jgi:hypothetical protein
MPWSESDASHKTGFANTPKRRRMWAEIANKELAAHGDEGRAIRAANAVVHRDYRGKPKDE